MPKGIYSNFNCREKRKKQFIPTNHQNEASIAFLKSKFKGMLLYHKLGSGKTCTSLKIADKMIRKKLVKRVYILSPGSLRAGWINEYCKVCGEDPKYLYKKYIFVTYNYMIGRNLPDFSNSLVIIDEVHNLINGVKNRSFHPTAIYEALMACNNCRILALSGTPVHNYVYEFSLLGRLLKPGNEFPDIRKGTKDIDEAAFMKFFIEDKNGDLVPINKTSFKRRLEGIISYYPGASEEFVPKIIYMDPIKVTMTPKQEINYWVQFIQEKKLSHPPDLKLKKNDMSKYNILSRLYIMSKKHILSRGASNFFYPKNTNIQELVEEYDNEMNKLSISAKDLLQKHGGWIAKDRFNNGELYKIYSTKITALILNLVMHLNQKHVLFTFFKDKSGVYLIKNILQMCGIHGEIFSGDLDDRQRKSLLKRFNSEENMYGDNIRILLVTEAGAEGISVLEARHMHILESSSRMNKTIQAIGRVARYKSHIRLPKEEQVIKVWRYWSMATPEPITITSKVINEDGKEEIIKKVITDKETIDEILYKKGLKTIHKVDSFLDLLKNASVTSY